jgi:glycosyltransferase involved in cell wall biosynthesis
MHIVHCLTHSIDGGGQAIPYLLVKSLKQNFPLVKHTVVLPENGIYVQRFQELDIPVICFPLNRVSPLRLFSILKLFNQLDPDIIHSHGRGAGIYTRILPKIILHKKVIHTYHGFHVPENIFLKIIFILIERIQMPGTSLTIAVSGSEKREIEKLISLTDKHVVHISNIIDYDEVIRRAEEPLEGIPKQFIPSKHSFNIVMIGRDDHVKNYKLAYKTAHYVLEREAASSFFFIGAESSTALEKLISQYPERVFQIPQCKNPLPILKQSFILLMTSKREGAPLVVLESFALGKPVVGTNVRGINDYVKHGENGMLANEEPDQLGEMILTIIKDVNLYKKLSQGAKAMARTDAVKTWSEAYYKLYNSIM